MVKIKFAVMAGMIVCCLLSINNTVLAKNSDKCDSVTKYYVSAEDISLIKRTESKSSYIGCSVSENKLLNYKNLEWIDVGQDNREYCSKEGILYSKDGSVLLYCPPKYNREIVYIDGQTKKIDVFAFARCSGIKAYNVDEKNEYFESRDGILYSKGRKILYYFPAKKKVSVLYLKK